LNKAVDNLKIKIFADGADIVTMKEMAAKPYICGLTTNPTLMRKAGVPDYVDFARAVLAEITDKPISFEVFSDDIEDMKTQGEKLAALGNNVNVKIPITNTEGRSTLEAVKHLSDKGIAINVTAVMTSEQVEEIYPYLNPEVTNYISVFAGRIADTGRDPIPLMKQCREIISRKTQTNLLWASPRELLNIFQADEIGCDVITATSDILNKLTIVGKDLKEFSRETVEMFYQDAKKSGYKI
jgi:transaldolase